MVDEFDFGFFLQLQKNLLQVQDRTAISGDRQKSDLSNLDTPRFLGRIATYREKQIVIQKKERKTAVSQRLLTFALKMHKQITSEQTYTISILLQQGKNNSYTRCIKQFHPSQTIQLKTPIALTCNPQPQPPSPLSKGDGREML